MKLGRTVSAVRPFSCIEVSMSKKTRKNGYVIVLAVLVLVAGIVVAAVWPRPEQPGPAESTAPSRDSEAVTESGTAPLETEPHTETLPGAETAPGGLDLGDGLVIVRTDAFSGVYMEDGSDEVVRDLLMIVLENRSREALQYAKIRLDYTDAQAVFEVTNLPAGKRVVLVEKNRMSWPDEQPLGAYVENAAFVEAFPMHEDIFQITTADGVINVKNISREDISGDIFVYYKNVGGELYYGGITYRVRIEGGLKAGEIAQLMTAHYYEDASEILMVSYVP